MLGVTPAFAIDTKAGIGSPYNTIRLEVEPRTADGWQHGSREHRRLSQLTGQMLIDPRRDLGGCDVLLLNGVLRVRNEVRERLRLAGRNHPVEIDQIIGLVGQHEHVDVAGLKAQLHETIAVAPLTVDDELGNAVGARVGLAEVNKHE